MEDAHLTSLVQGVLRRAPEWIRRDVASKDANVRLRAEESLAAMIAAAISQGTTDTSPEPS